METKLNYKHLLGIGPLRSTGSKFLSFCSRNHGLLIFTTVVFFISACRSEIVPEPFLPSYAHEAYQYSLEQANLDRTALGRSWKEAGENALYKPEDITLPYQEEFYLDPAEVNAVGYRFFVLRGLRIEIEMTIHSADSLQLFSDLFRQSGDPELEFTQVASANRDSLRLEFEPRRDSYYILRLQPELLRGGRFRVLIREVPSIGFPVQGKNSRAILSFFGNPRDAGKREHHGVDIFAVRHTPVLAPSDAEVTRVGEGEIGGRYVWLRDQKRSINMYFAHLQTQEVTPGTRVVAGQIIGTVGNTGNARTTPPHLHFGIYSRGPIDPYHFIAETNRRPAGISGDSLFLGELVRSKQTIIVNNSPGSGNLPIDTIVQNSIMKITALTSNLYHILLPDGSSGYIAGNQIEMANNAIKEQILTDAVRIFDTPGISAVCVTDIKPGEKFAVLGKFKNFIYGRTFEGRTGWIPSL